MNLNTIGQQLKEARKRTGISQLELAAPLGMSRATISAIESGRCKEIGVAKLISLLEMVGLEVVVRDRRSRPTIDELRSDLRAVSRE